MATHFTGGDLELTLLRTFLAVVSHGSLGKTATAIDRTQPAVTQQMMRLEKIVGQRLFSRGREGITLTHHGQLLVSYANRALDLNDETLARLRTEKAPEQLSLGVSTVVALLGLAPALKRFQSIYPDLELKVASCNSSALEGLLKAGKVDLVVAEPSLLTGTPLAKWRVPLDWAACKGLRLDQSRPVPLVLFEGACAWQTEMLDSLRTAGWEWRITFESGSLDAILTAVQSGLGIAALPAKTVRSSKLARVESAGLPPAPTIQLAIFRGSVSQAACTVLEDIIASVFESSSDRTGAAVCPSNQSSSLTEIVEPHDDREGCHQSYGEQKVTHASEEVHREHSTV